MSDIEEKRMYADRREATVVYVAGERGLATVSVSGDQVGRFGIAHRCRARDVATGDAVYVATDEGVLVGPEPFESLDFGGGAVAVTVTDAGVLAAGEDGDVRRHRDGEWTTLGTVADVRALSGAFVAAAGGVCRVRDGEVLDVGLSDARDVTADGVVLAATGEGLYRLGNGWLAERDEPFDVVAAGADGRAHAATGECLYARRDGDWEALALPVAETVAGVAYGECVYAVTAAGTMLVAADPDRTADGAGGWRSRALGLPGVRALAVA